MDQIAQKIHYLTMLYLSKVDLPKDITPAELIKKYEEAEKQIGPIVMSKY